MNSIKLLGDKIMKNTGRLDPRAAYSALRPLAGRRWHPNLASSLVLQSASFGRLGLAFCPM